MSVAIFAKVGGICLSALLPYSAPYFTTAICFIIHSGNCLENALEIMILYYKSHTSRHWVNRVTLSESQ